MMVVVRIIQKGDWNATTKFLKKVSNWTYMNILKKYGEEGVKALSAATPKDSGLTAASWSYEIQSTSSGFKITWNNTNLGNNWFPIALMLQYGHGTGTGGWVEGLDYINPAIRPVFEELAKAAWKEVKDA